MPDAPRVSEPLRRIAEANLRYYEGLGRLTVEYLRALHGLWNEVRGAESSPSAPAAPVRTGVHAPEPPAASYPPASPPAARRSRPDPTAPPPAPALVLEGEGGAAAGGLFRVSNDLRRTVSAPVVVSPFRDAAGGELRVAVRVEPGVVTLDAGQAALVQVHLTVPDEAEPGATYHAEVDVPGLAEGGIPLVLRRLHSAPATPAAAAPAEEASRPEEPAPAEAGDTGRSTKRGAAAAPAGKARRRPPRAG